jgi:hypothetical protein
MDKTAPGHGHQAYTARYEYGGVTAEYAERVNPHRHSATESLYQVIVEKSKGEYINDTSQDR